MPIKKILVIEDNEQNMYLMEFLLKKKGYAVLKAMTGEEGFSLAIAKKPDLILMDIQLPDFDGLTATKKIKKIKGCKNIPIIAVTSHAMMGDEQNALRAGCDGYIEKPIDPYTFLNTIEKHFK